MPHRNCGHFRLRLNCGGAIKAAHGQLIVKQKSQRSVSDFVAFDGAVYAAFTIKQPRLDRRRVSLNRLIDIIIVLFFSGCHDHFAQLQVSLTAEMIFTDAPRPGFVVFLVRSEV